MSRTIARLYLKETDINGLAQGCINSSVSYAKSSIYGGLCMREKSVFCFCAS